MSSWWPFVSGGFRGGEVDPAPPPPLWATDWRHHSWYVTIVLYYGDTIATSYLQTRKRYSEYSKWLPPVASYSFIVHQICFRPGIRSPDFLAGLRGLLLRRKRRDGKKGEGRGEEGKGTGVTGPLTQSPRSAPGPHPDDPPPIKLLVHNLLGKFPNSVMGPFDSSNGRFFY